MSLSESVSRDESEPPDSGVDARTTDSQVASEPLIAERPPADPPQGRPREEHTRVQRQFETHCILRMCNTVDDENTATGVETMRHAERQ